MVTLKIRYYTSPGLNVNKDPKDIWEGKGNRLSKVLMEIHGHTLVI